MGARENKTGSRDQTTSTKKERKKRWQQRIRGGEAKRRHGGSSSSSSVAAKRSNSTESHRHNSAQRWIQRSFVLIVGWTIVYSVYMQHQIKGMGIMGEIYEKLYGEVSKKSNSNSNTNSLEGFFLTHSTPYHTIFSTGCSPGQDWQSYVFFYHVMQSGQEGHTTRIASGCNSNTQQTNLQEMFDKEIASMRPGDHHLHQTPDFSNLPKNRTDPYHFFNKPFGVRHWMENALGYPENHHLHDNSIIILMDPDQVMMRPFTNDFTNSSEKWRSEKKRKLKVEHGSPFAQQYGYALQWLEQVDIEYVFQDKINFPTPVSNISREEASTYYSGMGPPYIATAKDMWSIVNKWSEIAPKVHDEYPHLLAEMFAYNLAVAHLGIRHTIATSFMVSYPGDYNENFELINKVSDSNICTHFPASALPHVIHYCQKYHLGKWFFYKERFPEFWNKFFSCEAPLLKHPPDDLASKYTSAILPWGKGDEVVELTRAQAKQHAYFLCALIDAVNTAAKFYKDQHCEEGSANYEYSHVFHKDMRMPNETIIS